MGRIRTIKPEFFIHEELFDLEQETGLPIRVAYAGLFTVADKEGRFEWRPRRLKAAVLPYDEVDFSRVLDALATRGFLVRYAPAGREYGAIRSWRKHQVINNREKCSEIPEPPQSIDEQQELTRAPRVDDACPTPLCNAQAEGEGEGEGEGEQDSEPVGSDAAASNEPQDLKSRIFGSALDWLAKQAEKSKPALRPMVGRWCRDHGDGAVLEAFQNAARAGPVEPIAWIEARLAGTARQTFGQPFKTSELLERMAEDEADRLGEEGDFGGDVDAVPLAIPGPERGPGSGLPNGDHRKSGAVQPNRGGTDEHVGEVQAPLDEDDMADAGGAVSGHVH